MPIVPAGYRQSGDGPIVKTDKSAPIQPEKPLLPEWAGPTNQILIRVKASQNGTNAVEIVDRIGILEKREEEEDLMLANAYRAIPAEDNPGSADNAVSKDHYHIELEIINDSGTAASGEGNEPNPPQLITLAIGHNGDEPGQIQLTEEERQIISEKIALACGYRDKADADSAANMNISITDANAALESSHFTPEEIAAHIQTLQNSKSKAERYKALKAMLVGITTPSASDSNPVENPIISVREQIRKRLNDPETTANPLIVENPAPTIREFEIDLGEGEKAQLTLRSDLRGKNSQGMFTEIQIIDAVNGLFAKRAGFESEKEVRKLLLEEKESKRFLTTEEKNKLNAWEKLKSKRIQNTQEIIKSILSEGKLLVVTEKMERADKMRKEESDPTQKPTVNIEKQSDPNMRRITVHFNEMDVNYYLGVRGNDPQRREIGHLGVIPKELIHQYNELGSSMTLPSFADKHARIRFNPNESAESPTITNTAGVEGAVSIRETNRNPAQGINSSVSLNETRHIRRGDTLTINPIKPKSQDGTPRAKGVLIRNGVDWGDQLPDNENYELDKDGKPVVYVLANQPSKDDPQAIFIFLDESWQAKIDAVGGISIYEDWEKLGPTEKGELPYEYKEVPIDPRNKDRGSRIVLQLKETDDEQEARMMEEALKNFKQREGETAPTKVFA